MKAARDAITDIGEKGRDSAGNPIVIDRRLFMQFLCFGSCQNTKLLIGSLSEVKFDSVLYVNIGDPWNVGLLTISENPDFFLTSLRDFIHSSPFASLTLKPEFTMLGRTYALGHERDIENWLIDKPRRTALNPRWPWAIWYPLRRKGRFSQLDHGEQRKILAEHGAIGRAFGNADHSHDIRLACHGLDANDNDFVIGVVGKALYPLSATIQAMRSTRQTSEFIKQLGPFFVGKAAWQSPTE